MDVAVKVAPRSTWVIPLPEIAPTICEPLATRNVAEAAVWISRSILVTLTLFRTAVPAWTSMSLDVPPEPIPPAISRVPPVMVVGPL